MSAEVFYINRSFDPVRVELTSPGTQGGRPFYLVDFVEADGGRYPMWDGLDFEEACQAARDCGDCGNGVLIPVFDLTGPEPVEVAAGAIH